MLPRKWFVVYTNPQCEELVKRGIERLGFEAYLPVTREWRKRSARQKHMKERKIWIDRPLLTRYLFVALPAKNSPFGLITALNGVHALLGDQSGPLEIQAIIIEKLKEAEDAAIFDKTRKIGRAAAPSWAIIGQLVLVKEGPFAAFCAQLTKILVNDRVQVLVEIFGRPTSIELGLDQVEQIS